MLTIELKQKPLRFPDLHIGDWFLRRNQLGCKVSNHTVWWLGSEGQGGIPGSQADARTDFLDTDIIQKVNVKIEVTPI
jgi:hypothetical protein